MARTTTDPGARAPRRNASYAMPAMIGIATSREPRRHQMPGVPNSENTNTVMIKTMIRKFVPQRTCSLG